MPIKRKGTSSEEDYKNMQEIYRLTYLPEYDEINDEIRYEFTRKVLDPLYNCFETVENSGFFEKYPISYLNIIFEYAQLGNLKNKNLNSKEKMLKEMKEITEDFENLN